VASAIHPPIVPFARANAFVYEARFMSPIGPAPFARALVSIALVGLAACGAAQQGPALSYGESARRDYERALGAYRDNDCLTATPLFQHVRREYPYSRYAALAELRAADCELEQQHYSEAIRQYRSFIRARPTHADLDYAHFRVAVAYFRQIPQDFFLSPPREERDQGPTRSALRVIERFVREYEDSEHVEEAQRMQRDVLALLARHELFVADFYLFRDRPRATISRIEGMLEDYQGSGLEPLALVLLGRTYLHMGEADQARVAFEDVVAHYGESGFAAQARNFLERMDRGTATVDEGEPPTPDPEPATDPDAESLDDEALPEPEPDDGDQSATITEPTGVVVDEPGDTPPEEADDEDDATVRDTNDPPPGPDRPRAPEPDRPAGQTP